MAVSSKPPEWNLSPKTSWEVFASLLLIVLLGGCASIAKKSPEVPQDLAYDGPSDADYMQSPAEAATADGSWPRSRETLVTELANVERQYKSTPRSSPIRADLLWRLGGGYNELEASAQQDIESCSDGTPQCAKKIAKAQKIVAASAKRKDTHCTTFAKEFPADGRPCGVDPEPTPSQDPAGAAPSMTAQAPAAAPGTTAVTPSALPNEPRHALVIGNGAYADGALKNPVNDATAMADALRAVGFTVVAHTNQSQKDMKVAIRDFGRRLQGGGVGLFYYAGHGIQMNGQNYLMPIGAKINAGADVDIEGVRVAEVLAKMDGARNRLNMVILDACRNNPFARSFRSASRGLAVMDAPNGTIVAYATAPGSVAADGSGSNGVYTGAFVKHLRTPGAKVEDVFKKVRVAVRKATGDKQTPWESSSLTGDFYFIAP